MKKRLTYRASCQTLRRAKSPFCRPLPRLRLVYSIEYALVAAVRASKLALARGRQNHRFFAVVEFGNWLCLLFFLPLSVFALEVQPWFGDVYEFHLLSSYTYSRFHKIQGGDPSLTFPFQVNLMYFDLDFSPSPEWSIDVDLQVADTSRQSFNVRTAAIQARYLWLDDIIGDRISFDTGASIRFTPAYALHDVSCPSHGNADFVLNFAIGKELEATEDWLFRLWGYGEVGHANRGSPWIRGILAVETNLYDHHKFALYADGTSGYGRYTHIDVNHFDGYAKIRNKSIDLGFRYGYRIGVWGTMRFEYMRRVLARASPAQVNSWIFSYLLPFSL